MTRQSPGLFGLFILTTAALLALSAHASLQERHVDRDDDEPNGVALPTGQYVTPTAVRNSVVQYLNPGLPAYPDFVAGEAVRSQLSPDGTVDVASSTQFVFLYNVEGANKSRPLLTQVLKQPNAHVGLVFSPDGNTLYAAGGNDDAVYVYTRSGGIFAAAGTIALGHFAPGAIGSARNKGVGLGVQPNASGLASPATAARWSSPTTTTTRSASSTRPPAASGTSTICVRGSPATKAGAAAPAAPSRLPWSSREMTRLTCLRTATARSWSWTCLLPPRPA